MALIIFDIDGVMIDVAGSYREAARKTARAFLLKQGVYSNLPDPLFSLDDLAYVKQSGGLNNDWDLTYRVVDLLSHRIDSLTTLCGEYPHDSGRFKNDYGTIKAMFQEIYLGNNFDGLITTEKLFLPAAWYASLAQKHTLAIATGRPRQEAEYALSYHGLQAYFAGILTLDDCEAAATAAGAAESFGKPHPYMLDTLAAAYPLTPRYFVGDMPDDMQAAKSATKAFTALGAIYSCKNTALAENNLRRAQADVILKSVIELERFAF